MNKVQLYVKPIEDNAIFGYTWGEIYFKIGEKYFPSINWTDFISRVLSMWSNEIIELLQGKNDILLMFMDGPYAIHISFKSENTIYLSFRNRDEEVIHNTVDLHQFLQHIIMVIDIFLKNSIERMPAFQKLYDFSQMKEAVAVARKKTSTLAHTSTSTGDGLREP